MDEDADDVEDDGKAKTAVKKGADYDDEEDNPPTRRYETVKLDDVDKNLSDWAKDMLSMYWDKIDLSNSDMPPEEVDELAERAERAKNKRAWAYVAKSEAVLTMLG
jgi:hypothetical protein